MSAWLSQTIDECRRQVKDVVNVCTSVRTIHKIRTEANGMERPAEWTTILQRLSLPADLDLFACCYQPLFAERVKEIVSDLWLRTIEEVREDVAAMMEQTTVMTKGIVLKDSK